MHEAQPIGETRWLDWQPFFVHKKPTDLSVTKEPDNLPPVGSHKDLNDLFEDKTHLQIDKKKL